MQEENSLSWLQEERKSLVEAGLQPVALIALDHPTILERAWTDGSLQASQLQDLLATYASELAAHGLLDGARMAAPFARQLSSSPDRALAIMVAPRHAPRVAAIVRGQPGTDFAAASHELGKAAPRNELIEMAAALCEATGASAVVANQAGIAYASRAAFVQHGATGPFLGLACLSRQTPEALAKLHRAATEGGGNNIRREQFGPYTMCCFVKRIGENNLALAASRFNLTRAELAEAESMIAGLSCKESAARLHISPETVRQRRKVIYRKLGVESCGTAVARILELELPPAPPESQPQGSLQPSGASFERPGARSA